MKIGQKISACRKKRGMSQEDLAERIEVSRQAVSRWETGESVPDVEKIKALCRILSKAGYETTPAYSGTEAKLRLDMSEPDLILLDLMLPGVTGEEIITYVRDELRKSIPIIVLSAKSALDDRVGTIRSGADDYITKPFEPEEVVARVMAALRRSGADSGFGRAGEEERFLTYKRLVLSESAREVTVNGQMIAMTPHEFEILRILAEHPDKVFSREKLYEQVWENGYYGEDNTVNVHVSNIRKKIAAADPGEEYIKTV